MATETKSNLVKIGDPKTKFDSCVINNRDSKHKYSSTTTTSAKIEAKGKSVITCSNTKTKTTTLTKREKKVYSLPGQKFDVPEEREPLRIFYESLSQQIPSSEMAEFWMMEHGMLSLEKAKKAYEKKQRRQKQIRMGTPIKSPPPPPSRGESSKSRPQQFLPPSRGESSKTRPHQISPPSRVESSKTIPQQFLPPSRGESSNKPLPVSKNQDAKEKKRIINDSDDDDDDFVLSHKRRKI